MTKPQTPDLGRVWILRADRLPNSVNGNPRFDLTFVDEARNGQWTYRLSSDAACGYEVSNFLNSGELVNVYLTKAERVAWLEKVES